MPIDVRIHIDLSPRQKRLVRTAVVAGAVIGALGLGVAVATPPHTFVPDTVISAAEMNDNFIDLDSRLTVLEGERVPPGTIIAYGGAEPPAGWLPCDGSSLDGTDAAYAALYAAIGTGFGGNPTSQTFNLPDLRGRFLRGVDDATGRDPEAASRGASNAGGNTGDNPGSVQGASLAAHSHTTSAFVAFSGPASAAGYAPGGQAFVSGSGTGATGGAETRPLNVSVHWIIKL
jgi:microcystin-dependent protein